MSAALYWKERLQEGAIFYSKALYEGPHTFKTNPKRGSAEWPYAVNRISLYDDYCVWFHQRYLPQFKDEPYYRSYPEDLPERADELGFFATIGPWLYVVGKNRQVRNYSVPVVVTQDGCRVTVNRKKYFVRLCSLAVHRAAYELFTGTPLIGATVLYDPELASIVNAAQCDTRETTERNKASMDKSMIAS